MAKNKPKAYWKENIRYLFILLIIWFIVSFVAGIMYVFVVLIFIYVRLMNKLDKKYGYDK
jgi:uncharacterized membrane protein